MGLWVLVIPHCSSSETHLFLCRVTVSLVVKVWDTDVSAGHPPVVLTGDMIGNRLVVKRKVGTN